MHVSVGATSAVALTAERDDEREDRILNEILAEEDEERDDSEWRNLRWFEYLNANLSFPFKACSPIDFAAFRLNAGEAVEVLGFSEFSNDRWTQICVCVRSSQDRWAVPLEALDPLEADETTCRAVQDWQYWVRMGYAEKRRWHYFGEDLQENRQPDWDHWHTKAREGDLSGIKDLLLRHVPPEVCIRALSVRDVDGLTPLHNAAYMGHENVLRFFLDWPGVDRREIESVSGNGEGSTALHMAVLGGQISALNLLVEYGADVQAQNTFGHTALHEAARVGHAHIAARLLELGLAVDVAGGDFLTPLCEAVKEGHCEVARMLLEHGADPHQDGMPWLLENAAAQGRKDIAALLVEYRTKRPDRPSPK